MWLQWESLTKLLWKPPILQTSGSPLIWFLIHQRYTFLYIGTKKVENWNWLGRFGRSYWHFSFTNCRTTLNYKMPWLNVFHGMTYQVWWHHGNHWNIQKLHLVCPTQISMGRLNLLIISVKLAALDNGIPWTFMEMGMSLMMVMIKLTQSHILNPSKIWKKLQKEDHSHFSWNARCWIAVKV